MTFLFLSLIIASWILYLLVKNHLLENLQLEKYDLAREVILSGLQVDPLRYCIIIQSHLPQPNPPPRRCGLYSLFYIIGYIILY